MTPAELVAACRVPATMEERRLGPWEIRRFGWPDGSGEPFAEAMIKIKMHEAGLAPFNNYTALLRPKPHDPIGEVVMEDSPRELRKHLPILMQGKGRILITGLGLGCVVRGLLTKPEVSHIDVVEIDPQIVSLAGEEFRADGRVTIHLGDALTMKWKFGASFDYAWHDIWTERGEQHLQVAHGLLITKYDQHCPVQGAWNFPRPAKRAYGRLRPILGTKRRTQREYADRERFVGMTPKALTQSDEEPRARVKFTRYA